jgi:hypothetical protein
VAAESGEESSGRHGAGIKTALDHLEEPGGTGLEKAAKEICGAV